MGPWKIKGGKYFAIATGSWNAGNADLQIEAADGTFVSVGSTTKFTANGTASVDLPPGIVQLVITTSTGVSYSLGLIRPPA